MGKQNTILKAANVRWDLSDLYAGADDAQLESNLKFAGEKAEKFKQDYYGKIAPGALSADVLSRAIKELEDIYTIILRAEAYAYLAFSVDTVSDVFNALKSKTQEVMASIQSTVLFFELEIQQIASDKFENLFEADELKKYRHYLEGLRLYTPYTLSEKEEQVINKKNLTGKSTFVNFYQEYTSSFRWEIEVDGDLKTLTAEEMRNLLRRSEANLRKRAKRAYDSRYAENQIIFTNVFNAIVKDHALETEMRNYENPIEVSFLRNRISREIVETMMDVTTAHNDLAQEYYRLKASLLKMPQIRGCDLVAPVVEKQKTIPFDEGRHIILEAFDNFSPEVAGYARQMFERKWIDAEVRPNKRLGAYCYGVIPELHPYIMVSYSDDIDNVYTLAHELGHAIHDFYSGRKQRLFNYHPPLVAAETASVFAEMLVTRKLLDEATDREFRISILTGKLEDLFGTIHTQNYYTRFELDAHLSGKKERLSANQFCELWTKRRTEMFGDAVEFLPEQKWYWSAIPHFIHTRFYCYAYTFGALLVLALYHQYQQDGKEFVPRYVHLLETGGSESPEDMIKKIGFDIRKAKFWESGFRVMRDMLEELKGLVRQV